MHRRAVDSDYELTYFTYEIADEDTLYFKRVGEKKPANVTYEFINDNLLIMSWGSVLGPVETTWMRVS